MSKSEFTGKTIEEAIELGLQKLNLSIEEVDIKVLEEPVKKLIGSKKAKVLISTKLSDGKRAVEFIDELLQKMNFLATGELIDTEDSIIINLITTNSSSIIGYRGEVLDAFQCLAGAVANIGRERYKRVVVDCENYRGKREETLKNLAKRLAEKAVTKARKITLEPMNPYERRVIHSALSENESVKTLSEGREPNRYIAIIPNNMRIFNDRKPNKPRSNDFKARNSEHKSNFQGERPPERRFDRQKPEQKNFTNEKQESESVSKKPKGLTFGTFLGNSLKED